MIRYKCLVRYVIVFLFILGFMTIQANVRGDDVEVLNLNPSFEEVPDFKDWTQYVNGAGQEKTEKLEKMMAILFLETT